MLGCEIVMPEEMAAQVQRTVEAATGEPCPCKQGLACPLLSGELFERVPLASASA